MVVDSNRRSGYSSKSSTGAGTNVLSATDILDAPVLPVVAAAIDSLRACAVDFTGVGRLLQSCIRPNVACLIDALDHTLINAGGIADIN
jgi:hypothetical protein